MKQLTIWAGLWVFESFVCGLAAQGTFSARITDDMTGAPVAGAQISILDTEHRATSDAEGRIRLVDLGLGTWAVEIRAVGYRPMIRTDVVIRVNRVTTLDVEMSRLPLRLVGIEVRPSYFPIDQGDPVESTTFSAEEIRRAPGAAGDVSRILQTLPSLAKVNDQSNALIVRGGSPLENFFLVDGIEIPNINHFPVQGSSSGPIGLLNADMVQELDFSAGGFGAQYGDRLSSVMDVRLREGSRDGFEVQFDLNFAGVGGVIEGPIADGNGSWMIAARRSYVDLAVKAFDVGTTAIPVWGDYQGKIAYDLGAKHRLSLIAVWADDHLHSDLAVARENAMLAFGGQDLIQGTTGVTWSSFWSEAANSNTSLAYGLSKFDEDYFETATGGQPLLTNRSAENAVRFRHRTELHSGPNTFTLGADASGMINSYDNRYESRIGPVGDTIPAVLVNGDFSGLRGGVFAQSSLRPTPLVNLSLGARVDYDTRTGNAVLSPRAAVGFELDQYTTVTAAGGLYRQSLPSVLLAQAPSHESLPDMRSIHTVLSFNRLLRDDLRLTVELYHKENDLIPTDPDEAGLLPVDELFYGFGFMTARDTLAPNGRARTTGVELQLHQKMSGSVYGMVTASFFRSRYRATDGVWHDRLFDNRVSVAAVSGWRVGRGFELSGRWIYAGGAPFTPLDLTASSAQNRSVLDETRINDARYPEYHSLNLRVDQRTSVGGSTLTWYISVWNAYNRKNVAQYYWNTESRAEEPIYQWSMLPIFGVEWEF